MNDLIWLLTLALAAYRLSLLIAVDQWPFGIMGRLRSWAGRQVNGNYGLWWTFAELISCPLCAGVWSVLIVWFLPKTITIILAVMGLQAFLCIVGDRE